MNRNLLFLLLSVLLFGCSEPLDKDDRLLERLMQTESAKFRYILDHRDSLEVQILYTRIDRDSANRPVFKSYHFNLDSTRYFYPASTVKLPLVLLALEKLNELNIRGLDKFTAMLHDSAYAGQYSVRTDSTSESGWPSVGHYARKILVVSDNDAYNRLYEFMGQRATNTRLHQKGYNIRILHRLERALSPDQNRHTEAVRFVRNDTLVFQQPMLINPDSIRPARRVLRGKGYMKNNTLVRQPLDFTYKNDYPLQEQQEILKAVLFPDAVAPGKHFNLSEKDRRFVMQYMSQLPVETSHPPYQNDKALHDAYCKFLMFGEDTVRIPPNLRIFNKVGDAYGYLIDNAYIVDFDAGVEFMLSAVINTNRDGIYNDDLYDYKTIGYPFMKDLGQLVYRYELKRKRTRKPNLDALRLPYDH